MALSLIIKCGRIRAKILPNVVDIGAKCSTQFDKFDKFEYQRALTRTLHPQPRTGSPHLAGGPPDRQARHQTSRGPDVLELRAVLQRQPGQRFDPNLDLSLGCKQDFGRM